MLVMLPVIIVVTIFKMVSVETPEVDNRRTRYCVAESKFVNGEVVVGKKTSCTKGSMSVEEYKPGLAERKSK